MPYFINDDPFLLLFGIFYVIAGISIFRAEDAWNEYMKIFADNKGACLLGGYAALFIGLMIVLFHNNWDGVAETALMVIGYIAVVKGVFLLIWPGLMQKILKNAKWIKPMWAYGYFAMVLGAVLLVL